MAPRILFVADVTAPGGVDAYVRDLFVGAQEAGFSGHALVDDGPGAARLRRMLTEAGAGWTAAPLYHRAHDEKTRDEATRTVLDSFRPDLVHAVCGAPWTTVVPREAALAAGLPLVFTEQYVAPGFTFEASLLARIAALYERARTVIAVSRENARLLADTYGLPARNVVVIPNAVRTEGLARPGKRERERIRASLGLPSAGIHAVTLARLVRQKGLDVLIRAVGSFPQDLRAAYHFSVIGEGPLEAELRSLAARLGVQGCFEFLGWREDAAALLPAFDLFVLPSRAEGQPLALAEALAAGLPAIATAVSGIPEMTDEGRGAELVPPEDPAALAGALVAFADDPGPLRAKAGHGRAYVRRHHDRAINLARVVDVWRGALSPRR